MSRPRRLRPIGLLLGLALCGMLLLWWVARSSLPQTRGRIGVAGLRAETRILRGADGVPHIYAETDVDASFALGFAHAQDRMWQMEMNRRIATGRLSEVFGATTLETDKFLRTLGLHRAARSSLRYLQPRSIALLEAYSAGVNAFLESGHGLPPEFSILRVHPEPWQPEHSLAWAKMLSWDLSRDWDLELLRMRLSTALGPERAAELLPSVPLDGPRILESGAIPASTLDGLLAIDDRFRVEHRLRGLDVGSNSWVVSGAHSASGAALLANDPHLGAQIPSVWYLVEMHGDRLHATGASLPGAPGIVLGRNRNIAWGATNLNPDVQDLVLEQIDPANPNRYRVGSGWREMTVIEERIEIKDEAPLIWAARATRNGPLLSDVLDEAPAPLALRWPALDPDDTTLDAFLDMSLASDWQGFQLALERYVTPSQNLVYADRDGHIGYLGPGRIPNRASGDGREPVPGWDDAYAWTGYIPFEDLPRAYDPPAGFIATANNKVVGEDYPYHLGSDWAPPYRAERIVAALRVMLASGQPLTAAKMQALQSDQLSLQATELLPVLQATEPEDARQTRALDLLEGWDGRMDAGAPAPALYQAWLRHLTETILADDLSGALLEQTLRRRHPVFLAAILKGAGESPWCDNVLTPPVETCPDAAREALDAALDDLEARLGPDPARWRWGALHRTRYDHNPFSQVALLRPIFHRSIENGGDPYTVNVANIDLSAPFDQINVPSFRQVVDLASPDESVFMQTTGQSGHPLSPHYDDLIEPHRDGAYLPMRLDDAPPEGDLLLLVPLAEARD